MTEIVLQVENVSKKYRTGKGMLKNLSTRDFIIDKFKEYNPFNEYKSLIDGTTFWALRDINFTVNRGDTIGIVGRNGAGKSTLLKILSKITPPTEGIIKRKGRVTSLLEVGTGFHTELTGKENIFLNGAILGLTRKEIIQKFDEIVAFSGVEHFLDTPIKRYSSGMKIRLAFSVAAHLESDILIIDEVLAVGDADFQKKCLQKMEDVTRSGRTVLFVSHNSEHILRICKKGIMLDSGKIVCQGEIGDVMEYYLNSTRSLSSIPFRNRENRKGNGALRITEIKMLDEQNQALEYISPGQDVNWVFEYEVNDKLGVGDISIVITVLNALGLNVFIHHNMLNAIFFSQQEVENANQFVFSMKNFPFPQGDYFLSFRVGGGNKQQFDLVKEAICFKVGNSPFGKNVRNPRMRKGTTLIDGIWSLQKT